MSDAHYRLTAHHCPTVHYRALEWLEESQTWEANKEMDIQVVVEVSISLSGRRNSN